MKVSIIGGGGLVGSMTANSCPHERTKKGGTHVCW
jgi:hypothetical protein